MWWLLASACAPEEARRPEADVADLPADEPLPSEHAEDPALAPHALVFGAEELGSASDIGSFDADGDGMDELWLDTTHRLFPGPLAGEVHADANALVVVEPGALSSGAYVDAWVRPAGDIDGDGLVEVATGGAGHELVTTDHTERVNLGSALEVWRDPFGPGRERLLRVDDPDLALGPLLTGRLDERDVWLVTVEVLNDVRQRVLVVPTELGGERTGADLEGAALAEIDAPWWRPTPLRLEDLDGDGLDDLVVSGKLEDDPAVWIVNGPLAASTVVEDEGLPVRDARVSTSGDVDGDGHLDLLGTTARGIEVWHGPLTWQPSPSTAEARLLRDGSWYLSIGSGEDLDGDGTQDLVVGDARHDDGAGRAAVIGGDRIVGNVALEQVIRWSIAGPPPYVSLGNTVRLVGDVVGDDGIPDVAATALGREGHRDGALFLFSTQ